MVTAVVGSGTSRSSLEALGIKSNGNDDQLSTANLADLDATLLNSLSAVKELFTGTSAGIGGGLSAYLESVVGDDGTLVKHQATLTSQSAKIDTQVADLERWVVARSAQMTSAFVAMEAAQQKANNQLAFLTKTFG
jgi:flagellar capping protein FliD